MTSILFALPAGGSIVYDQCTKGLYNSGKVLEGLGIQNNLLMLSNQSLISKARSGMFSFFYNETNYDYMLFIDNDIGFQAQDVLKLLELNVPFAAGAYPMKVPQIMYNFVAIENPEVPQTPIWNEEQTAIQVEHIGTGFMLLRRDVYPLMAAAYPELKYKPPLITAGIVPSEKTITNSYHLFETMIIDEDSKPEDFSFCYRWRKLGHPIWMRPDINLTHTGPHTFVGIDLYEDITKKKDDLHGAE